jgi:hypothetical protein
VQLLKATIRDDGIVVVFNCFEAYRTICGFAVHTATELGAAPYHLLNLPAKARMSHRVSDACKAGCVESIKHNVEKQ